MAPRTKLKEYFVPESKNGAFYSGGNIFWSEDGKTIFCASFGVVNVVDVEQGRPRFTIGDDGESADIISNFIVSPDGGRLFTAHKSGLFKCWEISDGQLLKQWKYIHKGTVTALDVGDDLLISGGSDAVVRVWNTTYHTCSLALRGLSGVVSVVKFHSEEGKRTVFTCADDLKISCWDLETGDLLYQFSGHYSKITSISFHHSNKYLVSCGRDKVIMLWDLEKKKCIKTFPAFECLEGIACLEGKPELPVEVKTQDGVFVAVAGERGVIRIMEMTVGMEVYTQTNSLVSKAEQEGGLAITQLLYNKRTSSFLVATVDQNIIIHKLNNFECVKQLVGFSDEILDIVLVGPDESYFAVATNSCDIKLYNRETMGCQLLKGHTDLVLSLNSSKVNNCWMISAAKDHTVRLWELNVEGKSMTCLAVGTRHTALVSAVCFSQLSSDVFISVSKDTTLKVWNIKSVVNELPKVNDYELIVKYTEAAHDKDINSVAISPNDKLIATASQDKTIKLWSTDGLAFMATLRGHRRGVWCVRFSPVDQILLSSSADTTIKIWSVAQQNCLKTFEGHDSSVLRVEFLTRGMQIVSTSGDGLMKLWTIKDSECAATFEEHDGKIWALAVTADETKFLTGGSDSLLVVWRDATEEKRQAALEAADELKTKEQQLSNLLRSNKLYAALSLALSLDKPFNVLNILKELLKKSDEGDLNATINKLPDINKERLLKCAAVWNTNSKNCQVAQMVTSILLDEIVSGSLKLDNMSQYIEQLLPYSERHYKRLTGLMEELHFLSYSLSLMKPAVK
ncbi:UNVERIFIED_CONTAM: hypothetical protein PYX00_007677 [Menopon gallinae]|uniref:U3 small nucleolar RNA-associated protein 13 C-terminal domain-containing protein n=1 Tax=Menopon gallinae TaxID=328185 RepID=A0AAW2HL77_9NEOP